MKLGIRAAAGLLNVPEKTIYDWIKQEELPAHRINEQYKINREELLEWATSRRISVSASIFAQAEQDDVSVCDLSEALQAAGIHYGVAGADKASALRSVIYLMPLPDEVNRSFLLKLLLARETLGSTAIGDGIAIPHVRNPIVMRVARPIVTLCFMEKPIDFGALDGKPVHTLFTIVSPAIKAHLHVLSRLAFALRQPEFASVISRRESKDVILGAISRIEEGISTNCRPQNGGPKQQ